MKLRFLIPIVLLCSSALVLAKPPRPQTRAEQTAKAEWAKLVAANRRIAAETYSPEEEKIYDKVNRIKQAQMFVWNEDSKYEIQRGIEP